MLWILTKLTTYFFLFQEYLELFILCSHSSRKYRGLGTVLAEEALDRQIHKFGGFPLSVDFFQWGRECDRQIVFFSQGKERVGLQAGRHRGHKLLHPKDFSQVGIRGTVYFLSRIPHSRKGN